MLERIRQLQKEIENITAKSIDEAESLRIKYLSKKGEISRLFEEFRDVPTEQKREIGQAVNVLKEMAIKKINLLKESLKEQTEKSSELDLTLPGESMKLGTRHPISIVKNEILEIFKRLGFVISEGPEIEDDWHVFGALNFPDEHPARDMQDTFFIQRDPDILLRTHTSSVQVHDMETMKPPIRTVTFGRVFRNEAISYRAHCMFHQIEGLYVDENVSFADLKQTITYFAKEFFGENAEIRMRPSYFPFTEPSAEVDVSCTICGGKGCNVCKYTGWLEIMGCGMVDPHVFDALGIDSNKYTGFAFGMGIERNAMLRFGINDLRLYFENDVRFLQQFQSAY
jgi:phenylalanyl-tRNA synthetase alpha chain